MPLAKGTIHPEVWEVEQYLDWSLKGFAFYLDSDDSIKYLYEEVEDYIVGEAYELTDAREYPDVDLIHLNWTLDKCEEKTTKNRFDLAGKMYIKAQVHKVTSERSAIREVRRTLDNMFHPCSGSLTIKWRNYIEDVAEGAAA